MALVLALAGCGDGEKKDERIQELEGQVSEMSSQLETAQSAASDLSDEVDRFDTEDWQDVVGDVKEKRDELVGALEEQ
jgi:outer membrane murein-binding lipoprotein Lpp